MKLRKSKIALAVMCLMAFANFSKAQPGTLEMTSTGSNNVTLGPSTTPVTVTFREDIQNLVFGTNFKSYTPALTVTQSFANQQFTTTYGNVSTGMVFGGGNTASTGGTVQQSATNPIYNALGASLVQPPQNGMFVSSPTGLTAANWQAGGRGVGLDPEGTQNGMDLETNSFDYSFATAVFTTVEPLFDANLPKDGRYYYGDLVLTFNRPVLNPIVHVGGLGGSYNFQPLSGGPRLISYFSTELELQNLGVTSTFMSGNEFFNISGNNILNSAARPNGGSYDDGGTQGTFPTYGAATGSVRVNGVVTQLVYKVYVRGSVNSDFNFSQNAAAIAGATRDPFNGDLFYVAISLDKPTQQISGNVLNDADGLVDNNINQSAGLPNAKTNVGNALRANLINSAGLSVASVPVSASGSYLFNNVPVGTYTVQLSINAATGTYATPVAPPAIVLPAGWVNTGEFVGTTAGNDGSVNGTSASVAVAAGDIKVEVNFGIERLPESVPFTRVIPRPAKNSTITLNNSATLFLPILTGSDPEDMAVSNVLTGKSLRITTLPTNSTLLYNNIPVIAGQLITNYTPSLLQIRFGSTTNGLDFTQFNYAYVDAAGLADPTPALYRILWAGGPVAITLSEFTATKNNCTASLAWKTETEVNAQKFEIEYSTGNSGVFALAGTVSAIGNSSTTKSYQFSYGMQSGVVYYFRLKMVDKDGTFRYSDIRSLSCSGKVEIMIMPNPVKDRFYITGMASGINNISIYSASGQLVKTQAIQQTQGYVDISNMPRGMYNLKITAASGFVTVEKLIKE